MYIYICLYLCWLQDWCLHHPSPLMVWCKESRSAACQLQVLHCVPCCVCLVKSASVESFVFFCQSAGLHVLGQCYQVIYVSRVPWLRMAVTDPEPDGGPGGGLGEFKFLNGLCILMLLLLLALLALFLSHRGSKLGCSTRLAAVQTWLHAYKTLSLALCKVDWALLLRQATMSLCMFPGLWPEPPSSLAANAKACSVGVLIWPQAHLAMSNLASWWLSARLAAVQTWLQSYKTLESLIAGHTCMTHSCKLDCLQQLLPAGLKCLLIATFWVATFWPRPRPACALPSVA